MQEYYLIARIISAHGRKGFVRIDSFSDFPDRFYELKKVYIDFFDDKKEFLVEKFIRQKEIFALKFKNFDSLNDVSVLIGKEVFVGKEELIKLPKGYYFIHDLIGSKVMRNNRTFGKLIDVLKFPANDIYVIRDADGKEVLIPAVKGFVEKFDPDNKILFLRPGDDFYEEDEN